MSFSTNRLIQETLGNNVVVAAQCKSLLDIESSAMQVFRNPTRSDPPRSVCKKKKNVIRVLKLARTRAKFCEKNDGVIGFQTG